MSEPIVSFRHVYRIYRVADTGVVGLGGVDLDVEPGEFVAIVGPSGSGKSTVLNLIGGLDHPTAGVVEVLGRDLGRLSDDELTAYRRDSVGFVWQGTARNLVPYLSVRANVELPFAARGTAGVGRSDELLEVVGLADRAHHLPGELSGGEQQRAAVAVALANTPRLLLADEPTAELDSASAGRVLDAVVDVNRELDVTVVMVTHDQRAAARTRRSLRLRDGRLVRAGEPTGRVDEEGRVRLPERAIEALHGADLETDVLDGEVRIRRVREAKGDDDALRP
jgi:ABC-type lipoprotein export system ATPase subunit